MIALYFGTLEITDEVRDSKISENRRQPEGCENIDAAVHTSAAYTLPTIPVVVYAPDIDDSSTELVIDHDFEDSSRGYRSYHALLLRRDNRAVPDLS